MKRVGQYLVLGALVLCAGGCMERLVDFHVRRLVGVRVTAIDERGFDLRVRCELENPNRLGAQVTKIRFRSFVGQSLLGTGELAGPVAVKPKSRFLLEVPVRVDYTRLPADLPQRVTGGAIRLRTEADLKAKTSIGTYRMRLVSEDQTRIAEALEVAIQGPFKGQAFQIQNINLAGLELSRVKLRARVVVRNLFAFPIRIVRGDYQIAINGAHFGSGKLERPISIPPRSQVSTEVDLVARHGAVGKAIGAMLGQQPRFRLTGTVWIDPIGGVSRLPLDVQADSSIFGNLPQGP